MPFLSSETKQRLESLATTLPFRAAVAVLCLAVHLAALVHSGSTRFGAPFNAAPGAPPAFEDAASDASPQRWNRLVVSRWDAGQYVELGLRGYKYCPKHEEGAPPFFGTRTCNLVFYPTYGRLGHYVSLLTHLPIDYALFAISLLSSFVFLMLWTSRALTDRMGVGQTYLALLLFNAFTTGFSLTTIQTEPLTLACTMGSFVAFTKRRWVLAAVLAGAASSLRITGVATGAACALAIVAQTWVDRPTERREWWLRGAAVALSFWGAAALMAYHQAKFGDALAYVHAHSHSFKHEVTVMNLLQPRPEWLIHAMEQPLHEGVWLVAGMLWFLLGHRAAMRRFPAPEQAFWYALFCVTVGIAAFGQVAIWFQGMNRYLLLALPLFFSMAALLRARPLALAFWLIVSTWHYWQVDICTYTGGQGDRVLEICHTPHWMGRI